MDTSSTPTAPETAPSSLSTEEAGQAFAAMLSEPEERKDPPAEPEQAQPEPAKPNAQEEGGDAPSEPDDEVITVNVDGKDIALTKAQIAEAHKSGLRQDDYSRKTMELAEKRKAADAELSKTREERQKYAQGLQQAESLLSAQLQEQQKIDWQRLIDTDPMEYMRQQHLANTRQAQLQQVRQQSQAIQAQSQAEHQAALSEHVANQREQLVAKIPEWKDEAVMKAEATELRDYLKTQGLTEQEIYSVTDHRAIIQSRKAMLFDRMIAKASAATKKVSNTPQRVERPSGGETNASLDRRGAAYQRLSKTGSLEDAGAVFASLLT